MEITATRVAFVSVAGMTITAEVITGAVTAIIIMMITMVDITKNAAIIIHTIMEVGTTVFTLNGAIIDQGHC